METHFSNEEFTQSTVANSIYHKLKEYWLIVDESSQISALLDPRIKLIAFDNDDEKKKVKDLILELTEYYEVSQVQITDNATTGDEIINTRNYFRRLREQNLAINNPSFTTTSRTTNIESNTLSGSKNQIQNELTRYISIPLEDKIEPLDWWYVQRKEYPILSRIARDYLVIQATSVASEQAFSIAGQTITSQRNRLDPDTAQASLCLKSWIQNKICED